MATRIQVRRDTSSNWSANNPTLASGEMGFVTDENKIKLGDGATAWNSLDYVQADAYIDSVALGADTTGNYVETLISGDGVSISGEGSESASVTVSNTGVLSLTGTANEVEVSASNGNVTLSLPTSLTVDLVGDVTGNADTASTLATPRNISLSGDVSGSASFDGSADITITATVADDSHDHTIANVDGLQTALDNNASSASAVASDLTDHENATTSVHGIADTSLLATKDYADNSASSAAAALVDSAPETLNTLNELAAALGDDENFSTTVTDSIATKLSIASASATYLTQADAATTYDAIGSASAVASDLTDHENATTSVHGIADTSALATKTYADNAGVTSLSGTASEIDVSASSGAVTLSLPATINANTTGSAATLTTARTIALGGDLSGSASFDGSASVSISATLANSGVSASTYGGSTDVPVITVDSKGRITSASVESIVSLPDQLDQGGKFLSTDGTSASWQDPFSGNPTFSGNPIFTGQPSFTGGIRVQEMVEDVVDVSPTTNVYTLDYSLGNIFYSTGSLTGNFTTNITNAPTDDGRVFTVNHIVTQGATGYRPQTLNINGSNVTIKWAGGVTPTPTSSNGKLDIFTYTIIRRGGSFEALVSANLNF